MDVIEAHVRRLPPLDDRWWPRAQDAEALAEALLEGGVAGTATAASVCFTEAATAGAGCACAVFMCVALFAT